MHATVATHFSPSDSRDINCYVIIFIMKRHVITLISFPAEKHTLTRIRFSVLFLKMSVTFPSPILLFPFIFLILLYAYHHFFLSRYWSKRNIPHLKPVFLMGNLSRAEILEHPAFLFKKMYDDNREKNLVGLWVYFSPCLLILDLNLIRKIFIRDFDHFHTRDDRANQKLEPLSEHLFNANGKEWKDLRMKLRPAFASTKMKMMFPTMMACGEQLRDHLKKSSPSREEIGVNEVMARFTTDVITSCGFGIDSNSLQNPNSEFRKHGKIAFESNWRNTIVPLLRNIHPNLTRLLHIRVVNKEGSDFFLKVVRDTIAYRKETKKTRNDFLQLIIQLMNDESLEDAPEDSKPNGRPFTETYAAAQCLIFFLAGFETSSTALTCGLYELALNPDIQTNLQKEIDDVLSEGEVTYDKLIDMRYLDMVVHEILRMHPPGAANMRKCTSDYHIPEMNLTIEKGTKVFVSILGMHHDPKYYPNPERFDPERFSPEEKKKRDPMSYSPFGEGPRNCIGSLFGLMQIKIGLLSILREYTVEVCERTPIPLKMGRTGIILSPTGEIPLVFTKRV